MSYPKRLLRLRPSRGFASDTAPSDLSHDYYSTCSNVQFRNGFAQRIFGSRDVYGTMPVAPFHILNARSPGGITQTNFWLVFGDEEIHALEPSNSTDVTPSGGLQTITEPHEWSSCLLNSVPVANNGLDAPIYWAGDVGAPFDTLPDWPEGTICKHIAAFKYHLFALDIDGPSGHFEDQVLWSDAAPPGTVPGAWTPAADNQAGDAQLGDTPGPALLAVPMRGSLMIYKRASTYAVDYVGGNEVFSIRTLFTSSGALTRRAVCDVNGQHLCVTDGDIILTDGTNRRSIAQGRARRFLFSQLDQAHYENTFVFYNRAHDEVWICFPESGSRFATLALVYNVGGDAFGVRELDDTPHAAIGIVNDEEASEVWDDDEEVWDADQSRWNEANYSFATERAVVASGTTLTMHDTQDAQVVQASIGRHDLSLGEPERVKFVRRLHIRAESGYGELLVRVGARMTTTGDMAWSNEVALNEPDQIVDVFTLGRYFSVEVRSNADAVWTLNGIDIEYELRGYF